MVAPDDGLVKSDTMELCSRCIACVFLYLKEKTNQRELKAERGVCALAQETH